MTTRIDAFGLNESIVAAARVLAQAGGEQFTVGYVWPGDGEPPPGTPIVWYAEVTFPGEGVHRAEHGPTADHQLGMASAMAQLLRQLGHTVTILDPR